jgi:tetratricopeptide (TPR) repeat protein
MNGQTPDPRLAKYRLGRLLGAGGMGEVRLAHDVALNRDVAIKFIAAAHVSDTDSRRRLVREAQAAAALDHPAICAVYEVNADNDQPPFIVMQYVEGETLGSRLRRGPLEPREALTLAADIADALGAAHRRGIVHRDLKPENVMLTPSGRPKLLDFGIARMDALSGSELLETQTSLTGRGSIVGTPSYMSPEQIEQRAIDGRSDLFSLGCVLSECLTGRPAFSAATAVEICAAVLHVHPAPPSAATPDLTTKYDELCRRLLAKSPADRFQSADEVLGAIRMILSDTAAPQPPAVTAKSRPDRRTVNRAAAALMLLLGAYGAWWWYQSASTFNPGGEAGVWYQRGTEHVRNAAYYSARKAFEEAIRLSPGFPQALTLLAEAHIELDEESEAKDALLGVNQGRLGSNDRLRYAAVNALATGRPDLAVASYRQLASRSASEAGVWVDLGRAQQSAGLAADAKASFERALQINSQYAAAHLHIGMLESSALRREQALKRFADAEHLYRTESNIEGETEALLRRGTFLAALNDLDGARKALGRASELANAHQNPSQRIRGELGLATVAASEGNLTAAETQATAAVKQALDARLDTVAANGLVDLAVVLLRKQQREDAVKHIEHAVQLSQRRAPRANLRARLQLASAMLAQGNAAGAGAGAEAMLPDLRARGHRRWEMDALSIAARAYEDAGNLARARALTIEVLGVAENLGDETALAVALDNLAGQLTALGLFPEALTSRERGEAIHRRQKDNARLAFDLQNRAELLIRLGRGAEGEVALKELDEGAAAGNEAFAQRARRVKQLRALRATFDERFDDAARLAYEVVETSDGRVDSTGTFSAALLAHAIARGGRAPGRWIHPGDLSTASNAQIRELRYWRLATASARGDHSGAIAAATAALSELASSLSVEDRWRFAATGAAAALAIGDKTQASALGGVASKTLRELTAAWKSDAETYLKRPDLVRLRRQAGMGSAH